MLLQNMAPWHMEYFKPKGSEKWHMMEGRPALPIPRGKEHPYL